MGRLIGRVRNEIIDNRLNTVYEGVLWRDCLENIFMIYVVSVVIYSLYYPKWSKELVLHLVRRR
jgi:hypothetical protein